MFTNRLFTLFVAGVLVVVIALTVREAVATTALVADYSYDSIEHVRAVGHPASNVEGNRRYDLIEQVRLGRNFNVASDRSYDSVEGLRALRSSVDSMLASGYDQIESLRMQRLADSRAATSDYDLIELVRLGRTSNSDHSYDKIEALRLER
jgi:hypothetical protein